jgi:hypothetical protein
LIFSWKRNSHVQVKLMRIRMTQELASSGVGATPAAVVQLIGARVLESPRRVQFNWRMSGGVKAMHFDLQVRDASTRKLVFSRNNVLGGSILYPDPKAGKYHWQVKATLTNGSEVLSPAAALQIPGSGPWGLLALLAAIAGVGGAAWYYKKRERERSLSAATPARKDASPWNL